ncbi:hypothetical protein SAMN02745830_02126 [Streptomyces sp. Amel2xC10]|nr:hypothetical protein SAMN02745830_02126 [Streptomyces sp. Amel2xC10]
MGAAMKESRLMTRAQHTASMPPGAATGPVP